MNRGLSAINFQNLRKRRPDQWRLQENITVIRLASGFAAELLVLREARPTTLEPVAASGVSSAAYLANGSKTPGFHPLWTNPPTSIGY